MRRFSGGGRFTVWATPRLALLFQWHHDCMDGATMASMAPRWQQWHHDGNDGTTMASMATMANIVEVEAKADF